jgi:hypothetical protein
MQYKKTVLFIKQRVLPTSFHEPLGISVIFGSYVFILTQKKSKNKNLKRQKESRKGQVAKDKGRNDGFQFRILKECGD